MLIIENTEILWRHANVLKNILRSKTKIAFMLNLEIIITATAIAEQPLLYRVRKPTPLRREDTAISVSSENLLSIRQMLPMTLGT